MRDMTVRADDLACLEATTQSQRLRTIEPIRTPVGPELTLEIVLGNWRADEKRQRVVLISIATAKTKKDVLLVAVAIRAGVVGLTRRSAAR
jgi:hypothetical protein